jgi:hypothetical protein
LIRSTTNDVSAGLPLNVTITAGVSFIHAACFMFSAASTAARHPTTLLAPIAVGDDQGL